MTTITDNSLDLGDIFGADGLIARRFGQGYEERREQVDVARTAIDAIGQQRDALIEAGTGTGKSYALIAAAVKSGKRCVISTETNTLLAQYKDKDLPFLSAILPSPIKYAEAKGRGNYVCLRKVSELELAPMLPDFADEVEVALLIRWAHETTTGDRSEPRFAFREASWQAVGAEEHCSKRQCPFYKEGVKGHSECFACKARKAFLDAQIVVTNHKLLLINAEVGHDIILGPHEVVIVDEAHSLAEIAQDTFGHEIKQRTLSSFARYVHATCRRAGMACKGTTADIELHERALMDVFRGVPKQAATFAELPPALIEMAQKAVVPLIDDVNQLRDELNSKLPQTEEDRLLLEQLDNRAKDHVQALIDMFDGGEADPNWLGYVEVSQNGRSPYITLHFKPIDVAPLLREKLYSGRCSTIMASATLTVSESFSFAQSELGLSGPLTLRVDSPFDYAGNVAGYFPVHIPNPNAPDYHTVLADEITKVLVSTRGRALILFTSVLDMRRVHSLVSPRLKYDMMMQGDLPKPELIRQMKEDVHSCLFATRSFFTGVDIPGEALSCVILAKAPFRPPSEPLFAAKCQAIKARGGNDFAHYALPLMIWDLRQAFGRLVRNKTDRGAFVFLDSRAIKARYWPMIMRSLPPIRVRREL